MSLALHIIAKDEEDKLNTILEEYAQYFDEIVIAIDDKDTLNAFQKAKKLKLKEYLAKTKFLEYTWIKDFADKRNFVVKNTDSDYYFRLDCDDKIITPEKIRFVYEKAKANNVDVVYMTYLYSHDKDGNCNAKHWRETIIKKSNNHYWKKSIHENIYVVDQSEFKGVKETSVSIYHETEANHYIESSQRNFEIMLDEYNEDPENADPRTIAYIGRMLMGFGKWKEALSFLEKLVIKSGWEDDKYFAYVHIGYCLMHLDLFKEAISAFNEALVLKTEFPDAYLALSELYTITKDYKKAIDWGVIGLSKPEPDTMFVTDPSIYNVRAYMNMAMANLGIGDYELAVKFYDKAKKISPSNPMVKEYSSLVYESYENDKFVKNLFWLNAYIQKKQPELSTELAKAIPKNLLVDERVIGFKQRYTAPKVWNDKEIAIYCGQAWESWGPPSVVSGIGGSEEAVIYLSKELVNIGYDVTVYNSCGDYQGEFEGVKYKQFFEFNPNDEFNTVIAWRGDIFGPTLKAKKKLVWMHDVPQPDQFKGDLHFDKVIVLSEYHKSLLPKNVPEEKVFVSSNGINGSDFSLNGVVRNPYRMIYTSSYDRGLQHILRCWKDIKDEVPEAQLDVFYGWDTYDAMVEKGMRDPEFKKKMVLLLNQDGVKEHGRVGHKRLVREFKKSGLYVYPSHFEEISCISAMKAQACGCVPVVTNYAALKETVKKGVKVDGKAGEEKTDESFKDAVVRLLKDVDYQEKMRQEVSSSTYDFTWNAVAKSWDKELLQI